MAEQNKKMTPFQEEMVKTAKKILDYKLGCEANIVACLYKKPDEMYGLNLTVKDFHNAAWKTYFQIAYDLIITEKMEVLDDITIGIYLEKHPDLKKQYEELGGYRTISQATTYIELKNLNGYVIELRKWKAVIKLCKRGFPVADRLEEYVNMSAEEIYGEHEAYLNDTFANIDSSVKSCDISEGIHDLIERLDNGEAIGLPYNDMPMLTKETGGQYLGSITLIGGSSGAGKSTVVRSTTLPSIINYDEQVVVFINEESRDKWQREMLAWICNNILNFDIQKHIIRDGKYSQEVKQKLHEAADWLIENTQNHKITLVFFEKYKTSLAIKEIRKYASLGVKYFVLDTFKMDAGKISNNSWLEMQQGMVEINDVVKQEVLNVHILITFQLEKGSTVMRYYTQNNVGLAKNIVDVASTVIMVRDIFDDEYDGEKKALYVYRPEGKNGKTKVEVKLQRDKNYQVLFIVKNREGSSNKFQIVAEHDKSRNILREVGITSISPDSF